MKYCICTIGGATQHVTEDEFWRLVFQECMFGSQANIDNMERCLYIGHKYIGSIHMFWFEDIVMEKENEAL